MAVVDGTWDPIHGLTKSETAIDSILPARKGDKKNARNIKIPVMVSNSITTRTESHQMQDASHSKSTHNEQLHQSCVKS